MELNQEKVQELAFRIVGDLGGTVVSALGYVGIQLGLFEAMNRVGPSNSQAIATEAKLNERYVREWLKAMTAAEYINFDPESGHYSLTPEQTTVLCDLNHPMCVKGGMLFAVPTLYNLPRVLDVFRNGGGIPYTEIGHEVTCAIEQFFAPSYAAFLAKDWLGAIPGLTDKLQAGANVADIGCGRGRSTVTMAKAYPKSKFIGLDYHSDSIAAAMKLAKDQGVTNVEFVADSASHLPNRKFDLVCAFDCVHDMVDPVGALRSARSKLTQDGVFFWIEPNASSEAHENKNPVGRFFHAVSPLHCMTVSLAHGGVGLGTVIGETGARALAKEAGFSHFERLPIEHPFNMFLLLKP